MAGTRSQLQAIARNRKRKREQEQEIDGNKKCPSANGGINELPDDILINILSRVPLKEAARTSVLTLRWRNLWRFTTHGILRFGTRDTATGKLMERENFESWVNAVLKLHKARYVEGMVIELEGKGDQYGIEEKCTRDTYRISPKMYDKWVYFAIRKEVRTFELNISWGDYYRFPTFSRLKSLSNGGARLCRLRTLRLANVAIKDEVVHYILASCPNLEELSIHMSMVTTFLRVIDPPSLRVLEISRCDCLEMLEISAADLISLTFRGNRDNLRLVKIPNLRELSAADYFAALIVRGPETGCSYLEQLEKLVLDFRFILCTSMVYSSDLHLPRLYSLKRLEVFALAGQTLFFFAQLVKASPQLREFRIEMSYSDYSSLSCDEMEPFCAEKEKCINFIHGNLKVLEIGGYTGHQGQEELVLAFIEIGPSIERVIIDTRTNYFDLGSYSDMRRVDRLEYAFCGRRSERERTEAKEGAKLLASKIAERERMRKRREKEDARRKESIEELS